VPERGFPAGPGGRDGHALNTARPRDEQGQPIGEILVLLAALGLIVFGGYGLCEARWRRA